MSLGDFLTLAHHRAGDPDRHAVPRPLHPPGHGGRARLPQPGHSTGRAVRLSRLRDRRALRAGLEGLHDLGAGDGLRRHRRRLRRLPAPGHPAVQPGRDSRHVSRPGLQHVGQLRDQHELAELFRRDRRHVSDPGDGPGRPQLHLGRHRPGRGHRPHPWADPTQREDARQLLGRPDPRRPVHPPADLDRRGDRPRLAGRSADLESVAGGDHAPGRHPERSPWDPSPRRNGSRRWATTAAGSSTPTPPTRSRARRRSPTGSRCSPSS